MMEDNPQVEGTIREHNPGVEGTIREHNSGVEETKGNIILGWRGQ